MGIGFWATLKWMMEYKKRHHKATKAELDAALKLYRMKNAMK